MKNEDFEDLSDIIENNRFSDDVNDEESSSYKKTGNQEHKRHDARRRIDDLLEAKRLRHDISGFEAESKSSEDEDVSEESDDED